MPQICRQCSRANPVEALYCHFDGVLLRRSQEVPGDGSKIDYGTRAFAHPFVFAPGKVCRNFQELALACQADPAAARELLSRGYLENFLSSQGRMDLARAAAEAAQAPDPSRGLDDFLGQLPGNVLRPAQLRLGAREIDLGVLRVGMDRRFELTVHNDGQRLLYGTVRSECTWLVLGERAGVRQKHLEVADRTVVPVRVEGRSLRAYHKPQTGQLAVNTNGGREIVVVRILVPVQPFPEGILMGAISPREMAAKAKHHPKEAAALIESGAVARWYQANGWTYPVQGPAASGIGAVQQLFEALGLVQAPRVQVGMAELHLDAWPGESVESTIPVSTNERRPVVAYGVSDQPWLHVRPTVYQRRTALIPLAVPVVPHEPGVTLGARVTITANGNQRFEVHVWLAVHGESPRATAAEPEPIPLLEVPAPAAIGVYVSEHPAEPSILLPDVELPLATAPGEPEVIPLTEPEVVSAPLPLYQRPSQRWWRHLVPLLLLVLGLGAAVGHDTFLRPSRPGEVWLHVEPGLTLAPGEVLILKAQVPHPLPDQTLTLEVVEGPLVVGVRTRRQVLPGSSVTWRLRAEDHPGPWKLRILSSSGASWTREGVVRARPTEE